MRRKHTVLVGAAASAVGVDQAVKAVARLWPDGTGLDVVPGLVRWVHVENAGGVLGVLAQSPAPVRLAVFAAAAVGIAIIAWVWLARVPSRAWWSPASLGLIVGGAIGNSLDRVLRGSVTDVLVLGEALLDLVPEALRVVDGAPAFNPADVFLGLGLVGLGIAVVFRVVDVGSDPSRRLDPPTTPG